MENWLSDIPPVTRIYMLAAVATTAACALDLVSPFSLYLHFGLIFKKHEYWRLVTNLVFFGPQFNLDFVFHMFFLVRYCKALEQGSFHNRPADMVWMLILGTVMMTAIAPFIGLRFLGASLAFMMVYVWARRNPYAPLNFLGLFVFSAPWLPWVLLGFSMLFGNPITADLLGIACGHVYYYLEDWYPRMTADRRRYLKTPRLLELLFETRAPAAQDMNFEFVDADHLQPAEPQMQEGEEF